MENYIKFLKQSEYIYAEDVVKKERKESVVDKILYIEEIYRNIVNYI